MEHARRIEAINRFRSTGSICAITGKPLKFSEAIVLDDEYVCWEAYVEVTGAAPSTEGKDVGGLKLG